MTNGKKSPLRCNAVGIVYLTIHTPTPTPASNLRSPSHNPSTTLRRINTIIETREEQPPTMESLPRLAQTTYKNISVPLLLGLLILFWFAARCIYNLYFHPLSRLPGPKLWAASRLPFIYHLLRATLVKRKRTLHEKYGGVIRVAPDEVSFATVEAYDDIYVRRAGHKRPPRDSTLFFGKIELAAHTTPSANS